MGKIWNTYLKFGISGDQYLGRTLSLLDPDTPSFTVLPAHWVFHLADEVSRGLKLTFGTIIYTHKDREFDPQVFFLFCLQQSCTTLNGFAV